MPAPLPRLTLVVSLDFAPPPVRVPDLELDDEPTQVRRVSAGWMAALADPRSKLRRALGSGR